MEEESTGIGGFSMIFVRMFSCSCDIKAKSILEKKRCKRNKHNWNNVIPCAFYFVYIKYD